MDVPSILARIVDRKREELAARKAARPIVDVTAAPPVRDFAGALRGPGIRLIAEVKRASPSRGVFRAEFDPVALARLYAENGAACISVLTDEEFFSGHDRHLSAVREAVDVPLLRKDFVIDAWQIAEARALGADAVLLIAAILSPAQLRDYQAEAHALGMSALVEAHTADEVRAALDAGARLIGINNRDLRTFETSLETTERLAALVPDGRTLVSESGIFTAGDVRRVARCGARAVLVGEALVCAPDPAARVRELASVPSGS